MKIQNNFLQAKINKDLDERLVPNGQLVDAENFMVTSEDGGNAGVGKGVLGNFKVTSLNIPGAVVIGSMSDDANTRLFYFIKGTSNDYVMEFNVETEETFVVLKSPVGGALNFNTSYRITHAHFVVNSENKDTLMAWTDGFNPPRIVNIDRFKALFVSNPDYVFTSLEISVIKPSPKESPVLLGTTDIANIESNEIEDKFLSFCYRYKYTDGYYSAISQWSEYFFNPGNFSLNFETMENVAMLNEYNAVNISFNTGDRDVIGVDVLFKNSGDSTIYIVDKFKKIDEGWGDNEVQEVFFSNNKIYGVLAEDQYYRSFDNVPLTALTQCVAGNRLMYGNYVEGRDLKDSGGNNILLDFSVGYLAENTTSKDITGVFKNSTYTLESPTPTNVTSTAIEFTLPDFVTFKKGSSITIRFKIFSRYTSHTKIFIEYYTYLFNKDFISFNDFFTNSDFVNDIELIVNEAFKNEMINPPVGYTLDVFKDFEVTSPLDKVINIKIPAISYLNTVPDPDEYIYEYFKTTEVDIEYQEIGVKYSMKSNRSYEVAMYYEDAEGRKTTALTSANNTTYIPTSCSDTKNTIEVNIPNSQKPPSWASRYGFAIKQSRRDYESLYVSQLFQDDNFCWIKLEGQSKDKISVGDDLIIKRDKNGVVDKLAKSKVLVIESKVEDFITTNKDVDNDFIIEPAGLYAKIDATELNSQYSENEFITYNKSASTGDGTPELTIGGFNKGASPLEIPQGSIIEFNFTNRFRGGPPHVEFKKTYIISTDYSNFKEAFDNEIAPLGFTSTNYPDKDYLCTVTPSSSPGLYDLFVKGTETGVTSFWTTHQAYMDCIVKLRIIKDIFIFETLPKEVDSDIYFETPESYEIINGYHQQSSHLLTRTFNCFTFGNGAESHQIKDSFNQKKLFIDFCPTSNTSDEYKQVSRYADITYSGVYQSSTSVNNLNEFNLSTANYKDDVDKRFGEIVRMHPTETDILVIQEDKWSKVLYGKDLLYNSDATTNLSRIQNVLGQQVTYGGEYGISTHAESFDEYGRNMFCTDVKRGVVLRFNDSNGLTEISNNGMKDYFKRLFRDNKIDNIIGQYDSFYDIYLCNIKYTTKENESKYVTWVYSNDADGFATRQTFNPEEMLRVNNQLLSFKNGEVYKHNYNLETNYNTFYGTTYDSSFAFNFSQEPSTRKTFKTVEIEGTNSWDITLKTDLQNGYLNKEDLSKKEGVWYGYVRGEGNNAVDTATLSVQGVGVVSSKTGNVVTVDGFTSGLISVGDRVLDSNLVFLGTVVSFSNNTITLSDASGVSNGMFLVSSKSQSLETSGLLGYYMRVDAKFNTNKYSEVYSVNSEAVKSFS